MQQTRTRARLFVDADLSRGMTLDLSGDQAHYLNTVMRVRAGEAVLLFNGRDGEWSGRVESGGRGRCGLCVEDRTRQQEAEPGPWLAFAPVKKTAMGFLVEKATELGVTRLCPVVTVRTVATRVSLERLARRAVEAAEQCGRLTVPDLRAPISLEAFLAAWPADRRLLALDESGGGAPLLDALSGTEPAKSPFAILVGPEGGFAPRELDALANLSFVTRVGMGPRILRAETAALAALACWQAVIGDGRRTPPMRPAVSGRPQAR